MSVYLGYRHGAAHCNPCVETGVIAMGSFGDAVTSLVDTYTQCLAFLKDLGRGKQAGGEQGSELRRALRKARSKIRRVYSSKLSRQGSSFERGDGECTIRIATGPRAR